MNNNQRFIIINKSNGRIIGTDSMQPFTEAAAHQKAASLQQYDEKSDWAVEEIRPLFTAFAPK